MKIKITSPCMAMLIYEAVKSGGQTEGCLRGEMAQEVTKNITDSDVTTTTEDVLSVHSIGPIALENCDAPSEDASSNVFGWFRFCRRPLLRLTVREKSIHRKLARNIAKRNGLPGHVVTILMQERWSENHSTYLWKFAAFLQKDRWFIPCRVEIVNLKASSCGSYKPYPSIHQQQRLPQVTKALSSLNSAFSTCDNASFDMVQTVRNTGQEIVKSLNDTITKLRETESKLEFAYEEQDGLKRTLQELQALLEKRNRGVENDEESLNESDTSDSSDSAEYYGDEKPVGFTIKSQSSASSRISKSEKSTPDSTLGNAETIEMPKSDSGVLSGSPDSETVEPSKNDTPPPAYDPFDTLVDIAKADLQKGDIMAKSNDVTNESALLAEYNDERPWSDRTRAGRSKHQTKN